MADNNNTVLVRDDVHENTSLAAQGALGNRLQHRAACKIKNGHQGTRGPQSGLERGLSLSYWALQATFAK